MILRSGKPRPRARAGNDAPPWLRFDQQDPQKDSTKGDCFQKIAGGSAFASPPLMDHFFLGGGDGGGGGDGRGGGGGAGAGLILTPGGGPDFL
jgi:hypothetical protein